MENGFRMVPKRPQDHPEAFSSGRVHPGAPQESPRDAEIVFLRASGSVFGRLWTRLERHWGPEGLKMEPRMHPKRSCEAKRAEEERKSA